MSDNDGGIYEGMDLFTLPTRQWFYSSFSSPTIVQSQAWQTISTGEDTLIVAPTGSGKTLSAFLWAIDQIARESVSQMKTSGTKILYVSPMKALGVDIEKNLRQPLEGIRKKYAEEGLIPPEITVGVRSGDTTAAERRRLVTHPPDILITTPESLYLMLTSNATKTLATVTTVIIDEIHALAGNKRGAHLALSLERLDSFIAAAKTKIGGTDSQIGNRLWEDIITEPAAENSRRGTERAQRIGLSATVNPLPEVARFLSGKLQTHIVSPPATKEIVTTVRVPVKNMSDPTVENEELGVGHDLDDHRWGSIWPSVEHSIYSQILMAKSTIVFANSRRLAERLTSSLNEIHQVKHPTQDEDFVKAHHGSVSKEQRILVENGLKNGSLRCVVATASLELGIDMGNVDQIIQIDSPPSVASGLQRVGRAGHKVGQPSLSYFYPTHRSKLLEIITVCAKIHERQIEPLRLPSCPLDILAQQTVAAVAENELNVDEWFNTVCAAAPYRDLSRSSFESVLDLLSGKYPSTDFSQLRPRIIWDKSANIIKGRPGSKRLAILGGGTIPDRGLYRVEMFLEENGSDSASDKASSRIGELDEEMVHESRVGEIFVLGTSTWRIREITADRVKVVPAPGRIGKMPFWRGDSVHRQTEFGIEIGRITDYLADALLSGGEKLEKAKTWMRGIGLDENSISNTFTYLSEQREAAGTIPSVSQMVIEKTKDDVGDWQLILQSPLGMGVHAPWALAISSRIRQLFGQNASAMASNDGVIVRLPDSDIEPVIEDVFLFSPEEIVNLVTNEITASSIFAARFRECSARALLLGGGPPGKRSPLWQQRQRATSLLEIASKYSDFPMLLEAARECLQDVYDMDQFVWVMRSIRNGRIKLTSVTTDRPSPFAQSLLFGYVGEFLYQGDLPLGERRIATLDIDTELMGALLGKTDISESLELSALIEVERELQCVAPGAQLIGKEGIVDLLFRLGHLNLKQLGDRLLGSDKLPVTQLQLEKWVKELCDDDRIISLPRNFSNEVSYIAVVDSGNYLELLKATGVESKDLSRHSNQYLELRRFAKMYPATDFPVPDLLSRYARNHGPFSVDQLLEDLGLSEEKSDLYLGQLASAHKVQSGRFSPASIEEDDTDFRHWSNFDKNQWVDVGVLQQLIKRSASHLRALVKPVEMSDYASFLAQWQYCGHALSGPEGVMTVIEQQCGLSFLASALETLILPARVVDYETVFLDQLITSGEVIWVGHKPFGGTENQTDGYISLHFRESATLTIAVSQNKNNEEKELFAISELQEHILKLLRSKGALFADEIRKSLAPLSGSHSTSDFSEAIWGLVWRGAITSDSFAALRSFIRTKGTYRAKSQHRPRQRRIRRGAFASLRASAKDARTERVEGLHASEKLSGRWSLVPGFTVSDEPNESIPDQTISSTEILSAQISLLLDRYGVVARGNVAAESFPGGFSAAYQLLSEFEKLGHCRRGNFVEGLGGAQFAETDTVNRLREIASENKEDGGAPFIVVLSVVDPANPYGVTLQWPVGNSDAKKNRAVPRRNSGALLVMSDGYPILYLERGGKSAITFGTNDISVMDAASKELISTCMKAGFDSFTIETINSEPVTRSFWEQPLLQAGMSLTPKGLSYSRPIM